MAKQIRYGMVGGSLDAFIGDVHRKSLQFDTRVALVAGCFSPDAARNRLTAEAYGVERVYADYAAMAREEAARPDPIDFVSIVTPNHLHYAVAKAFLEAGIHVVCEKPLCFAVEEAEMLMALAAEKHLLFAVTYAYTGYTMVRVMREMVAAGDIGNIVNVNAEFAQEWLIDDISDGGMENSKLSIWRADPAVAGISNCVGDIGSHIENMVHYLTGLRIRRLVATVNRFGKPLDLNANMIVEYDTGVNGAYWCSQVAAGKQNGLVVRLYGDKGALEWEQEHPDFVRFTPKNQPTRTLTRANGYIAEKAGGYSRLPAGHPEGLYVGFANTYKSIVNALLKLRAGEPLTAADIDYPTVEDGVAGVRFIHAAIASGDAGGVWVDVGGHSL